MKDDKKLHLDALDFGPDSNVPAKADADFDAWIAKMAPQLNAPPASVPRAEMWSAIQAARATHEDAAAGKIPGVTPLRRGLWRTMSVIAAALLLGIALDRMVLRKSQNSSQVAVTPSPKPQAASPSDPSHLYRLAATQTLTQAEALLVAYRASSASDSRANMRQLGTWGRQVLGSTRLLLDSPAGDDPTLKQLLGDLELVLVQIIQLSGTPLDANERALVNHALEESDLLPRIRTAVPAGPVTGNAATE